MNSQNLNLDKFYPGESLKISEITQEKNSITIRLKSVTKTFVCSCCQVEAVKYHGTYPRKVQDLPILGKSVYLEITSMSMNAITLNVLLRQLRKILMVFWGAI